MPSTEVWETAAAILFSLGGGAAILAGLSGWLGKLWAKRILEKEAHIRAKELELLKSELAETLEKAKSALAAMQNKEKAELDHRTYVSKAQFDLEFKLYQELWNRLETLRATSIKFWVPLRKAVISHTLSQQEIDEASKQQLNIENLYQSFFEYFLSQSPFVAQPVKSWLDSHAKLLGAINGVAVMAVEAAKNNSVQDFEQISEAQLQLNAVQAKFADAIRQRLSSVSIIS